VEKHNILWWPARIFILTEVHISLFPIVFLFPAPDFSQYLKKQQYNKLLSFEKQQVKIKAQEFA